MSEGGTLKSRLEEASKALDEEGKRWQEAGLPNPATIYRMNDDELLHHCHLLAIAKILQEKFEVPQEELDLALKEVFLEELEKLRPIAVEARRQSIVHGLFNGGPPHAPGN